MHTNIHPDTRVRNMHVYGMHMDVEGHVQRECEMAHMRFFLTAGT